MEFIRKIQIFVGQITRGEKKTRWSFEVLRWIYDFIYLKLFNFYMKICFSVYIFCLVYIKFLHLYEAQPQRYFCKFIIGSLFWYLENNRSFHLRNLVSCCKLYFYVEALSSFFFISKSTRTFYDKSNFFKALNPSDPIYLFSSLLKMSPFKHLRTLVFYVYITACY